MTGPTRTPREREYDQLSILMRVAVCIPIYNDWPSVMLLLSRIDAVIGDLRIDTDVMLVDDGSTEALPKWNAPPLRALKRVRVLRLRRNLGHQRAIAIALTYLYEHAPHDFVVIMDGDGQDDPDDIGRLLDRACAHDGRTVVFARRTRRSENLAFRAGYSLFRLAHRLLVGRDVNVGNYSVLPWSQLARLVAVSELWNHYAASVVHARIPTDMVDAPRANRLTGRSQMNLTSLVTHGLSAISVYSDRVGVRLLFALAASVLAIVLVIAVVIGVRLFTTLAIPGWATTAVGLLVLLIVNLLSVSLLMVFFTLRARTESSFIPQRDYRFFVLDEIEWCERTPV